MLKDNVKISDYRYERKFFITELSNYEVENIVQFHPAIFSEIYHERVINNIYFDSNNLKNLHDNVDGATDRIKVRIRWYGDLFGYIEKPVLEIKIKKGLLGKKISVPMQPFDLAENTEIPEILRSLKYLDHILTIDFESLIPSLLNRYSRRYYQSIDKKFRITIDHDQSFYLINKENNSFLDQHNDNESVILELKYDQKFDSGVSDITSNFPFRLTKSSKYVNGIQKIYQIAF